MTLTSGWTRHVHRHGRAVVYGAAAWGVAIVGFGFADALWLALACLAVAGGMDTISGIFRSAMWNKTIPDHLRGRLAGVEMISWSSGPLLGDAEAGIVAALTTVRTSVVAGGIRLRRGNRRAGARAAALLVLRTAARRRDSAPHGVRNRRRATSYVSKDAFGCTYEQEMLSHQFQYPKVTPAPRPAPRPGPRRPQRP